MTDAPQSAVKKEIAAVNRRMLINKLCEDYTGRSILDARPSDIAKCKSILEQMEDSKLLLKELEVTINLIKEYEE